MEVILPILNPLSSNLLTKDNNFVGIKLFSSKNLLSFNIKYVSPSWIILPSLIKIVRLVHFNALSKSWVTIIIVVPFS